MPTKKNKKKYDEWDIRDAANILKRAKSIASDPELDKLAREHLRAEREALDAVLSDDEIEARAAKRLNDVFGD